ncbi:MAG: methylated-DNA--[protein]-cysteine S-methyltransferase [Ochrobactrum anthropi]|uniref:Methylated-DNA--[protein]-cysteine S-methyltransferase n=1 Tax=Brucella anthropi TaxID=529 RepID=A0A8I0TC03_BRUAN|nr:methylated-DNA--[protein]-cysteine S-methyltransferase [Brucella anthropi]MBE0562756.1 methylated-DNA--[protein]-cysteine S-methyltransferase [Brucella anthropi]
MDPTPLEILGQDYRRIERAVRFIAENRRSQPRLEEIAEAAHVSPYHFQRLFTRWAGVSPKRFMGYLTLGHARAMLEGTASVLETSLEAGLSGPGRLHDLFINFEAVSPGDIKRRGEGMVIRYGVHDSPFGPALVGLTERGICRLSFEGAEEGVADLARRWPAGRLVAAPEDTAPVIERIFGNAPANGAPLRLHVAGTNFQIKVWEAILRLPLGRLATYSQVGSAIGHPRAARAVGNALNANPVAFLIPCHAVVPMLRRVSLFAAYQGGPAQRAAIIGWEAARRERQDADSAPANSHIVETSRRLTHGFGADDPLPDGPLPLGP